MTERYAEIDGVIAYIHQNLHEPLTLAEMAAYAGYSPYHFSRIFKERVGLPPLYYVSALRLQKAKDLLLHTNLSVRDIGMEIGQQSLGTFTTRFTEKVGVTPAIFRNSTSQVDEYVRMLQGLSRWSVARPGMHEYPSVEGTVQAETPFQGIVLIGLFAKPIPEGLPLYGTLLPSVGPFCFKGVKPGIYYLLATSVSWRMQTVDVLLPHSTLRFRQKEPIVVRPDTPVPPLHVMLRKPRLDDPPILISLPVLMNRFLHSMQNSQIVY